MSVSCRQHLEAILAGIPGNPPTRENQIDMISVLRDLAMAWPGPLNKEQILQLHALCHKAATAKKIRESYDSEWKPIPEANEITTETKALFVAVLQYWAAGDVPRSVSLKCINAAFQAMEKFAEKGFPYAESLHEMNQRHLTQLISGTDDDTDE